MVRSVYACVRILALITVSAFLGACTQDQPASDGLYQAVDELYDALVARTRQFQVIAEIDHSRLAAAEDEVMPPARVILFSDPAVTTADFLQRRYGLANGPTLRCGFNRS